MDGKILTFDQIKRYVKSAVAAAVLKGDFFTPEMHRTIFRGKNLGNSLTTKQLKAIDDGSFEGLWLGDYWVINGVTWRIVDMDYWLNRGIIVFRKHHLVIMPDTILGAKKQMNTVVTTAGGYADSLMRITNMDDAKEKCMNAFGSNILPYSDYLVNEVTNGVPSGGLWTNPTIELPSAIMVFGHSAFSMSGNGTVVAFNHSVSTTQFSLFAVAPKFISIGENYWLRDVVSDKDFSYMASSGSYGFIPASSAINGIRPVFAIGVPD